MIVVAGGGYEPEPEPFPGLTFGSASRQGLHGSSDLTAGRVDGASSGDA